MWSLLVGMMMLTLSTPASMATSMCQAYPGGLFSVAEGGV
jgi:hypothetical protein